MKVLCVAPHYWPAFQYGGPIFVNHYLNVALVKRGIEVTVYTTNAGLGQNVDADQEARVDGVRVIYFSISKALEFLGATGWQFSWRMTKALRANLHAFDLVHINAIWNYPCAAAAFLSRVRGVPYVVTPHGALYPYALSKKRWKKLPYYHLIVRRLLNGAAAIHYTGEDEAEKCHSHSALENKAVVIPCVIDLSALDNIPGKDALSHRYPVLKGRKTILFLSRITWKKGLDILIKAFALVQQKKNDVHLLIVGHDEGGYAQQVKQCIRECGMFYEDQDQHRFTPELPSDRAKIKVTFTGMLTGKEKSEAYAGSDIFVLPSYSENFGVVAVEAMACGIPVIVSDQVGIHKEITESNAGVVVKPDHRQLAEAVLELLENPESCEAMGRNGRQSVKNRFAPDRAVDSMIEAYRTLF